MFDSFDGLPVHALVVHAVVVLLPLAVLGVIAIAVRPAWRRPYGVLVVGLATVATALVPVATQSGEELEKHVGDPGRHADLGGQLIWFALPLLVLALALVILDRRGMRAVTAVAVVAVVAAVATGVQVYRIGESGARAVWKGKVDQTVDPSFRAGDS